MKKMLQKTAAVLLAAATLCAGLPVISAAALSTPLEKDSRNEIRVDDVEYNNTDFDIEGSMRYDAASRVLTLYGDHTSESSIYLDANGLTIYVEKDVTYSVSNDPVVFLCSYFDLTITGPGKLTLDDTEASYPGTADGCFYFYTYQNDSYPQAVTLKDATLNGALYACGSPYNSLVIDNSTITGTSNYGYISPISGFGGGVTLKDCEIKEPAGSYINDDGKWVNADGEAIWTDYSDAYPYVISKIEKPLTIDTQPKAVSAAVGDTAKFTVAASGSGLSYQWQYYDGTWHNTSMTGAKTATLSVPVIAARNGLKYRCVITDEFGKTVKSNAVKLTVLPTITEQPKAAAGVVGGTAKFTVAATGAGLTYQWQYYDGEWHDTTLTGAQTATLSVGIKAARNGLKYRCVITDANGKTLKTNAVKLTVNPKITTQPAAVSAAVGDTAKFTVAASGAGLTYQWQYYDGTWHDTSMTGAKTATLSVPVIAGRNGLKYRCIITDANGTIVKSNAVKLTVLPSITAQPKAVTAAVGDTAKFTVKATGAGLTYQWQYYNPKTAVWADTTLTGAKTATLSVGATTGRNGLSYRCVITDANGVTIVSDEALLTVK